VKLITKPLIKENKIDSLALFKRISITDVIKRANTARTGYAAPLFVKITGIPFPVRDKTFTNLLEIDKNIKLEKLNNAKDQETLAVAEVVLNDFAAGIKEGHDKTHHRSTMLDKLNIVMGLLYRQYHSSLLQRASDLKERFHKLANYFFKDIGGKGGTEGGLPQTPA